jgi:hypothetical protein
MGATLTMLAVTIMHKMILHLNLACNTIHDAKLSVSYIKLQMLLTMRCWG